MASVNNTVAGNRALEMTVIPSCNFAIPKVLADLVVSGNPNRKQIRVYIWQHALLVKVCGVSAVLSGEISLQNRIARNVLIVDEFGVVVAEADRIFPVTDGMLMPVEISENFSEWNDMLFLNVDGFNYDKARAELVDDMELDPLNFELVSRVSENPGGVNLLNTDVEELGEGLRVKKNYFNPDTFKDFIGLVASGSEQRKKESLENSNVVIKDIAEEADEDDSLEDLFKEQESSRKSDGDIVSSRKSDADVVSKDTEVPAVDTECQVLEESSSARPKRGARPTPLRKSSRVNSKRKPEEMEEVTPKSTAKKAKKPKVESVKPKAETAKGKEVLNEIQCSKQFLCDEGLEEVYELLVAQGWHKMCEEEEVICPEVVQDFYKYVKLNEGTIPSLDVKFRNNKFTVSSLELAHILGLEHSGFDFYVKKNTWPEGVDEKDELIRRICLMDEVPKGVLISTQLMEPKTKILHKLLVSNFLQRGVKPSYVQHEDLIILDKLLKKEKVNLPKLIIYQMDHIKGLAQIGYSRVIKKILQTRQLYDVSSEAEVPVVKEFDNHVFRKMGLVKDPAQGWIRTSDVKEVEEDAPDERMSKFEDDVDHWMATLEKNVSGMQKELRDFKVEVKIELKEVKEALLRIAEILGRFPEAAD